MHLAELFEGLNVPVPREAAGVRVCDLTEDSRTVMPGSVFIARTGEKADGRAYVEAAVRAGAVAVLTDDAGLVVPRGAARLVSTDLGGTMARVGERFYGEPSARLDVIGVTGTNGKTTITYLIHQMLNALGVRCGLVGTVAIDDGVEVAPATHTTPAALELSRTLARMVEAGCRAAAIEVSSHALHQQRVGAVRFRAGVFTNLTHDHLDYHKTMEAYAESKAGLFARLPGGGVAVVNIMDEWHTRMVRDCPARLVRCVVEGPLGTRGAGAGTAPETIRSARVVGESTTHTDIELGGGWEGGGRRKVRLPLVGGFNVINALEALATVHALYGTGTGTGLAFEDLCGALGRVHAPPGRLEPVTRPGDPFGVFVDYAHTDDALRTVLGVVRGALAKQAAEGKPGRLWCVFGCGGDRDRTKRPKMGRAAAELADRAVITSDNPRTENPDTIIEEIKAGITSAGRAGGAEVVVEPDREKAIRLAIRSALPGDVVLIAGKGHENYQIVPDPGKPGGTLTRHFDDREVARAALGG